MLLHQHPLKTIRRKVDLLFALLLIMLPHNLKAYEQVANTIEHCKQALSSLSHSESLAQCLAVKKVLKSRQDILSINNHLIDLHYRSSDYSSIERLLDENSSLVETPIEKLFYERNKATYFYHLKDFANAELHFSNGFEIAKSINNPRYLAKSYNDMGLIHYRRLEYEKAINFYRKSLELKEALGNELAIGLTLNNLGLLYLRLEQYEKSLQHYKDALSQYKKVLHDKPNNSQVINKIIHTNIDLSVVYEKLHDKPTSDNYLQQAFDSLALLESKNLQVSRLMDMTESYLERNEPVTAMSLLTELEKQHEDPEILGARYLLYKGQLDSHFKRYTESNQYLIKAIEYANTHNDQYTLLQAYQLLSQNYYWLQDYLQAYINFTMHHDILVADLKNKFDGDLQRAQYNFEVERAEKKLLQSEIELLFAEEENHQLTMLVYLIVIAILILFIIIYFLISHHKAKQKQLMSSLEKHSQLLKELEKPLINFKSTFLDLEQDIIVCSDTRQVLYSNLKELKPTTHHEPLQYSRLGQFSKQLDMALIKFTSDSNLTQLTSNISDVNHLAIQEVNFWPICNKEYILIQLQPNSDNNQSLTQKLSAIDRFFLHLTEQTDNKDIGNIRPTIVDSMKLCIDSWCRITQTNKVEFADQSKIWKVNIDNGQLRTRSLDKYLSLHTLPKQPRIKNIIKSCHFMLSHKALLSSERKRLNHYLEAISQYYES